jgi:hypothetical protein
VAQAPPVFLLICAPMQTSLGGLLREPRTTSVSVCVLGGTFVSGVLGTCVSGWTTSVSRVSVTFVSGRTTSGSRVSGTITSVSVGVVGTSGSSSPRDFALPGRRAAIGGCAAARSALVATSASRRARKDAWLRAVTSKLARRAQCEKLLLLFAVFMADCPKQIYRRILAKSLLHIPR